MGLSFLISKIALMVPAPSTEGSEWNGAWAAWIPHLVVVSFLLGHCLHGQGSQAEVVLQKQGVDVLQWHVALGWGCWKMLRI